VLVKHTDHDFEGVQMAYLGEMAFDSPSTVFDSELDGVRSDVDDRLCIQLNGAWCAYGGRTQPPP